MIESPKRTVIWRICAYIGTSIVMYIATRNARLSFSFGLIDHSIKFVCQYVYERVWNKVEWGKISVEEISEIP